MRPEAIAGALAAAYLSGSPSLDAVVRRWHRAMGKGWRWLRPLARRLNEHFAGDLRARESAVVQFIVWDYGFRRALSKHKPRVAEFLPNARPDMRPVRAAEAWQLPRIRTAAELAGWLGIDLAELDWFADLKSLELTRPRDRLRHYHYRPLAKQFGQMRLIESPKPRLKQVQRRILGEILDRIPPHPAAHGFRRGRSITTFAQPHVGQKIVVRIDLQGFFPSIRIARIQALFRTVGYPEEVADLLGGLCTNAAPFEVWESVARQKGDRQLIETCRFYSQPHLPQGAPTSPALANLCAYRLDCRLSALASAAGATYTRYADDIVFSGQRGFARVAKRFHIHACATVMEEGFRVHHRKTRLMRTGARQHLAGLVVNERLNVRREDFDRLKAILTNCIRHGPATQNRENRSDFRGHLEGRLSHMEMVNPEKSRRLRRLFDAIRW